MVTKSFHGKSTLFVSCVKKINFGAKKGFSQDIFCLFKHVIKNIGFLRKLSCAHRISRCTRQIFVQNLLTYQNCFLQWQEHILPSSKVNFPNKLMNKDPPSKLHIPSSICIVHFRNVCGRIICSMCQSGIPPLDKIYNSIQPLKFNSTTLQAPE